MQRNRCGIYLILVCLILGIFLPCVNINKCEATSETNNKMIVHYIDVGQGDSTFIELPDGKTMLIDAGQEKAGKKVVKYIKSLGYEKIDYLIATHSDSDHIGGFKKVFEEFEVGVIYRPFTISVNVGIKDFQDEFYPKFNENINLYPAEASDEYAEFLYYAYKETFEGNLSEIRVASSKEVIYSTSAQNPYIIKFYWPEAVEWFSTSRVKTGYTSYKKEDNNDTSCIVELITDENKYLFCGDLTSSGEQEFLSKLSSEEKIMLTSISILKVSHHGSGGSTSEEFLNLVHPKFAVISVGKGNEYNLPDQKCLERLAGAGAILYRTDNNGTIIVEEKGGILYFSNIKEESFWQKYDWLLYTLLGIIVVAITTISIVYPRLVRKGKIGYKDVEKSLKPVDKKQN